MNRQKYISNGFGLSKGAAAFITAIIYFLVAVVIIFATLFTCNNGMYKSGYSVRIGHNKLISRPLSKMVDLYIPYEIIQSGFKTTPDLTFTTSVGSGTVFNLLDVSSDGFGMRVAGSSAAPVLTFEYTDDPVIVVFDRRIKYAVDFTVTEASTDLLGTSVISPARFNPGNIKLKQNLIL